MSRTPNRLARERSPYLLQHALNPVDWFPWGDEAFDKARREDRPVFLSIGYSTCHWCHVMERESFEDEAVAALLNEHFVAVKVDREERPDVDRVYMTAMQALGLGGGWPLTVFMTPALEPFFGGTYFPRHSVPGRIGMLELLPQVQRVWAEQRETLVEQGARVLQALAAAGEPPDERAVDRATLAERCVADLARAEDTQLGGFGSAPKFPQPSNLAFLFHHYALDPDHHRAALDMALRQLDAMRSGGIHDQLGGGFHRYATDRAWRVPHFEKMLYDQSQLAWAYLAAWQLTGRDAYAATARGIFDYVRRDLTSPEGAFHSAEDADSEGEEGRFYVWTPEQLAAELSPEDAALFAARFGVTPHGNFEGGTSILHLALPVADAARAAGLAADVAEARLEAARVALREARERRPRPLRDDKVLAAWNGLMVSAFARGARALGDATLAATASRAAEFVWTRMRDPATGGLWRRWRDGEASAPGQLDDYAYTAYGYIDLYRATFDAVWLERALALTETMIARFADEAWGGFFDSPAGDPHVRVRLKSDYDGAENSGNSIAALNLVVLGRLCARPDLMAHAEATFACYAPRLDRAPAAMPQLLIAMSLATRPPRHLVVTGDRDAADTRALVRAFDERYLPDELLLLAHDGARAALSRLAPFAAQPGSRDGRAVGYVCVDYACSLPAHDARAFAARLDELAPPRPISGVIA